MVWLGSTSLRFRLPGPPEGEGTYDDYTLPYPSALPTACTNSLGVSSNNLHVLVTDGISEVTPLWDPAPM